MISNYLHTAIGAMGVIVDENSRILLTLSKDRGWEPPGGFIEPDESLISALKREILEESAYEVKVLKITGIYRCIREVPIISFCFLCAPDKLTDYQVEESLAVKWVNISQLENFVSYLPHLLRIKDALTMSPSALMLREYEIDPYGIKATWKL
jgi:ADP-ribose pyrophosphatase YjhB (NUDIX family)